MKKKTTVAQATKNPIGNFISQLPSSAIVLGVKCYRGANKSKIYLTYFHDGVQISSSLSWEGGII